MGQVVRFKPRAIVAPPPARSEKAAVLVEYQETKREIEALKTRAKALFARYAEMCKSSRSVTRSGAVLWAAKLALLLFLALQASG